MIAEDGERRVRRNISLQISKEELTKWIVKAIKAVDEEEADERMREVDVNGDSLVRDIEINLSQ